MDPVQLETYLTIAAMILIAAGVGGGAFVFLSNLQNTARRKARLAGNVVISGAAPVVGAGALGEVVQGVKRIGDRIAVQDPAQVTALRQTLMQAGFASREAVTIYLGAKAAAMAVAIVAVLLLLPWAMGGAGGIGAICLAGVFAVAAILGPDRVVAARRAKRELEYRDGFPDLLDLLVASVEAGLSLDAAVNRVGDELARRYPNLAEHLRFLTLELRAGKSRKESWSSFAERLNIDEAASLATMLRQAEEMGTSLGDTLAVFSDDMRAKRMLRAEEKAMALPAKLMIPLILFIFPCLMGVLILPAGYHIAQTLAK
ncbi:MAG: type II secretion system F family protein [Caulobacteraceae bacterium]